MGVFSATWTLEGSETFNQDTFNQKKCFDDLSLIDLAEHGAPLAALGIHALWKLCADGLIYCALEQANTTLVEVAKRLDHGPHQEALELPPEGVSIN